MRFCRCGFMLYLHADEGGPVSYICKACGYRELLEPKTKEEALMLETNFRSGSSAGGAASGINVNSYTLNDPTLPHLRGTNAPTCPKAECPSQADSAHRDVIYIKTDPTNLKFQYICVSCTSQWTN